MEEAPMRGGTRQITLRERAALIADSRRVPLAEDGHPGNPTWRFSAGYRVDLQERLNAVERRPLTGPRLPL